MKKITKSIIVAMFIIAIMIPTTVLADDAPPPCIAEGNCPRPPGHENDPIAPVYDWNAPPPCIQEGNCPTPPGIEVMNQVPVIVEEPDGKDDPKPVIENKQVCYPYMDCWRSYEQDKTKE